MKIVEDKYMLGENARDNWDMLSQSKPEHYFFHLSSFPSAYVILVCEGEPSQKEILRGAQICKENTKYRNLKNLKVDYCPRSNVCRGEVTGEAIFISIKKVKQVKV